VELTRICLDRLPAGRTGRGVVAVVGRRTRLDVGRQAGLAEVVRSAERRHGLGHRVVADRALHVLSHG